MQNEIVEARFAFIKYLLQHYDIYDKNTVWLLNLIKDKNHILSNLQFNKSTHLNHQLIIFENFKVHLILSHGIYTNSDVIFHYLLQNEQRLYVNLMFYDKKYDAMCLQELMHQIDFLMMDEQDLNIDFIESMIDINEILSSRKLFLYLMEQINEAIEATLLTKNETRFIALTAFKKSMEEKKKYVI
ncbi:YpiB family protein [Macrococcoides caseolyticum]|uniref:YpiB family protein n=1 Tax=Macrococcoides caseolyticum TaxID=69966 RepID=UPI001F3CDD3C|nr:YpiB family protein [Macrococcus caseolyticus]MCE4957065.1 YpiB family protein [Macrococcus caseolyticus]